jgi:HEPN domain-containing protein
LIAASGEPGTIDGWIARAQEDVLTIRSLLRAAVIPWTAVTFHAQQAAEKYLKALFIRHGRRPPRSHDLTGLLHAAREMGYPLPGLDDTCASLAPYAVEVRYPDDVAIPTERAGRAAVAAFERIVAAVGDAAGLPPLES